MAGNLGQTFHNCFLRQLSIGKFFRQVLIIRLFFYFVYTDVCFARTIKINYLITCDSVDPRLKWFAVVDIPTDRFKHTDKYLLCDVLRILSIAHAKIDKPIDGVQIYIIEFPKRFSVAVLG